MSTYAIGDVQGCRRVLDRLLRRIGFNADRDRLWFAGDLVNRGPDSLGVLRFVRSLGDGAVAVLGNHDLHLLARWMGVRRARRNDTLSRVLRAKDRDALLTWLRRRPLVHTAPGLLLVHAGLAPEWTARDGERQARKVERALRGDDARALLSRYSEKTAWPLYSDDLPRKLRLLSALNYMTRVRCLRRDGAADEDFTGPPGEAPLRLTPWYAFPRRRARRTTIVFGHWAALGAHVSKRWIALDSGCAWGRALTAVRLEDRVLFQAPARGRG